MFNKVELIAGAVSVTVMVVALLLVQNRLDATPEMAQEQEVPEQKPGIIIVDESGGSNQEALAGALLEAVDTNGNFSRMVIDDIKVGNGAEVKDGDTVLVHYAGTLQNGTEFDNSRERGAPFEFTVGAGMVIKGWEEGLVGMKEGGERILVIPPEKGYGAQGIGPIPGDATLVFRIELLEVS